jgi:GNAT superfamily N-acetyltransferase
LKLRVETLNARHDLSAFSSGNLELDGWLQEHARHALGQGTRTYVVVDRGHTIVGYFSIIPHVLDRDEAPKKLARGAPRQIPGILLAKLALSESLQGQGLGAELLICALATILDAARVAGGTVVIVDAIDPAAAGFYRHHDLEPLPNRADRLVLKLSTIAKALDADWP